MSFIAVIRSQAKGSLSFLLPVFFLQLPFQSAWSVEMAKKLSDFAFIRSMQPLELQSEFTEYAVNWPLDSSGLEKQRWLWLPNGQQIQFQGKHWVLPVGTILVKHFSRQNLPVETRVIILDPQLGWTYAAYEWNSAGNEAYFVAQSKTITLPLPNQQDWIIPGPVECRSCHQDKALGLRAEQFNRIWNSEEQYHRLQRLNWLPAQLPADQWQRQFPRPDQLAVDLERRARTYLDVNCATCHNPQGLAPGGIDFTYSTPLPATQTVYAPAIFGPVDGAGSYRILPGDEQDSVVWRRIVTSGPLRMPPQRLSLDLQAENLIKDWIRDISQMTGVQSFSTEGKYVQQ